MKFHTLYDSDSLMLVNSFLHIPCISDVLFNEKMKTIGEIRRIRLEQLVQETASETLEEVAEKAGVNAAYLSQIRNQLPDSKTGKPKEMGKSVANKLGAGFNKPIGWMDTLDATSLPIGNQDVNVSHGPSISGGVPLISFVQAGNWMDALDSLHPGQGERITTTIPIRSHTYALRVDGDSMTAESGVSFPAGCIIIVEPEMQYESGDFVIVRNGDNQATFKQIVRDGSEWMLKPLNPRYPIKPMPHDATICGVVRGMEMRFK